MQKIKRCLCKIDSGALTFHNIFHSKERNQFKMLKQFLINLEIWGSYTNLNFDSQGVYNAKNAKKMTEFQLYDVLEYLLTIVKETKSQHFPIMKMLTEKAGVLGYFLVKILKHIQSKTDEENANLLNGEDDDFNEEDQSFVSRGNTRDSFVSEETINFLDISKSNDEDIGYYIPLS
mmetsp:Transcript_5903/g.5060  ORF Transcript_5903/g.5060 Transcript_5903/m.5060 type:complete len:176 (+) Transcript_5903:1185-1712(+)